MAGLMTALALRESGVFTTIDVFEQTRTPSTAGAGLNIPPNAARLARWLGVDLDGGDPKGPHGAIDGGRAAILSETRMVWEDGHITRKPLDHNTAANDNAGFKLVYESTSGLKTAARGWFTIPDNKQWHTVRWQIDDAQFVVARLGTELVGRWRSHLL